MKFDNHDIDVVWLDLDDTVIDFLTNSRRALERLWHEEPLLTRLFPSPEEWTEVYERHNHALWDAYSRGKVTREKLRMERFRLPLAEGEPQMRKHRKQPSAMTLIISICLPRSES